MAAPQPTAPDATASGPTPPDASAPDATRTARDAAQRLDAHLHALASRWTSGLSPVAMTLALVDMTAHWATQPAQSAWLGLRAWQEALDAAGAAQQQAPVTGDDRFADAAWARWPWSALAHGQRAAERWWRDAAAPRGIQPHHGEVTRFFARQWLDTLSPSNVPFINPQVRQRTRETLGANLVAGAATVLDQWRVAHGLPPRHRDLDGGRERPFQPGVDVAITPGQVVHRNHLVEVIQYLPTTASVQAEPVFIVPSWIMKYYILDLSPQNSMVRWLVDQGHTVFMLSWRNPDDADALLSMQDYLELGILDPLAALARLVPGQAVHACGYCLGGTLLAIAAAALARPQRVADADRLAPLKSLTLLAAETDFTEPGEMGVLIDEAQIALLEDLMAERGYLSGRQMAGSFTFLHARDLVWSQRLREWWLGEAAPPSDLMAWNADVTRMPAVMHSEYLRRCYLHNALAEGRYPVEGRPVSLGDIRLPMFVVGTEKDHVAPWKSVYKLHRLTDGELTFVLASGGHNAGIVSEPGHPHRHHAVHLRRPGDAWIDPADWPAQAQHREGSWWPTWDAWLRDHAGGELAKARTPAAADVLGPAPGIHVLTRYQD